MLLVRKRLPQGKTSSEKGSRGEKIPFKKSYKEEIESLFMDYYFKFSLTEDEFAEFFCLYQLAIAWYEKATDKLYSSECALLPDLFWCMYSTLFPVFAW
jgi:hypothetical protein